MAMRKMSRAWLGVGVIGAALLTAVAAAAAPTFPAQDDDRTCLVCHDDAKLKSSAGKPVSVDSAQFAASVHGRAGVGCVGCHADLKGFEDFPHAHNIKAVACGKCHPGLTANFAKGHVHELPASSGRSPAGIVRVLYKVLIGVMIGFFLLYVGVDLLRRTRERWTKKP